MLREIKITPVLNGWIVNVGCQVVVFDSISVLLTELENYLKDPAETEKKYREHAVNAKHVWREAVVDEVIEATSGGVTWRTTQDEAEEAR